eukprot:Nitzschia sp. Nitz4//scaffold3_size479765//54467//55192//NITZ4_000021-RA/size479765-processed-gene-0.84-mRNA-1//-1//CDS//3329550521//7099//frame0
MEFIDNAVLGLTTRESGDEYVLVPTSAEIGVVSQNNSVMSDPLDDDESYDYCDDVYAASSTSAVEAPSDVQSEVSSPDEAAHWNDDEVVLTVPSGLLKDLDEALAAAELSRDSDQESDKVSEKVNDQSSDPELVPEVQEGPASELEPTETEEPMPSRKTTSPVLTINVGDVGTSRTSNKKRRKKLKLLKKAQAAANAASALAARKATTMSGGKITTPRNSRKTPTRGVSKRIANIVVGQVA